MVPVFDIEGLYWSDGGGPYSWPGRIGSGEFDSFLADIRDAGWAAVASEAMFGPDCEGIRDASLLLISYGADQGQTLYDGECATGFGGTEYCAEWTFRHPTDSHTANYVYMVCGNEPWIHYDACEIAARYTPNDMGLMLPLWGTYWADGGPTVTTNGGQLVAVINELRGRGVNIKTVLWWAGWPYCPEAIFSTYAATYDAVVEAFGTERSRFPAP
jgi:hypothetical protein